MHRVDWLLLSVWKNTITVGVHLGERLHRQILEGGRRDVGICLSWTWGVPAGLGRPPHMWEENTASETQASRCVHPRRTRHYQCREVLRP
eukprot:2279141-Pyramimonas_sp.AAC.1